MRFFLAILTSVVCLTGSARADRTPAPDGDGPRLAGADSGSTAAVLLTVSGPFQGIVPVTVSDLRAAAANELTTSFSRGGFVVVPQGEMLSLMRTWRVRDAESLPRGFLDSLVTAHDVRLLAVVNVVVGFDGLMVAARYVDPRTGLLMKVGLTEWTIDAPHREEDVRWLAAAQEACRMATSVRIEQPASDREPNLILETQAVGSSDADALMASCALLGYYLEHGRGVLIDPAVTNAVLHDAGYSERYIGPEARALLRTTFACTRLLIPQLISYAPARRSSTQLDTYDNFAGQGGPVASDLAWSLRSIDLTSGAIAAGAEIFMATPEPVGWFGAPRHDTLMDRLTLAAGRLWSETFNTPEGF